MLSRRTARWARRAICTRPRPMKVSKSRGRASATPRRVRVDGAIAFRGANPPSFPPLTANASRRNARSGRRRTYLLMRSRLERDSDPELNPPRVARGAGLRSKRRVGLFAGQKVEYGRGVDRRELIGVERVVQLHAQLQPPAATNRHVLEER